MNADARAGRCNVFSIGSAGEPSFELGVLRLTESRCTVHAWDHTLADYASIARSFAQQNITLHNAGLAAPSVLHEGRPRRHRHGQSV